MRKHLRVAKPRETDKAVENDLRGLGDTNLFQDLTPEPVLTVSRSTLSFIDLANKLNLVEAEDTKTAGYINITCEASALSHKEKAINLFAFSLNLRVIANIDCAIWEKQRLHAAIVEAAGANKKEHLHQQPTPKQVTLSPAIQLHLKQAGFNIRVQEENLVIGDQTIRDFYHQLLSSNSVKTHKRKAG